jgi:hypothetical protein
LGTGRHFLVEAQRTHTRDAGLTYYESLPNNLYEKESPSWAARQTW